MQLRGRFKSSYVCFILTREKIPRISFVFVSVVLLQENLLKHKWRNFFTSFNSLLFLELYFICKRSWTVYGCTLSCIEYLHVKIYMLDGFVTKLTKGEIVSVTFLWALCLNCQFCVNVSQRPYLSKCLKKDLIQEVYQAFGRLRFVKKVSLCVPTISGILGPKPVPHLDPRTVGNNLGLNLFSNSFQQTLFLPVKRGSVTFWSHGG